MDPVSRRELWEFLRELSGEGVAILVSTPYMDEVERCDRAGLLFEGRLLLSGSPGALLHEMKGEVILLISPDQHRARRLLDENPVLWMGQEVYPVGEALHLIVENAGQSMPLIRPRLEKEGVSIQAMRKIPPTFEDLFISLIRKAGGNGSRPG